MIIARLHSVIMGKITFVFGFSVLVVNCTLNILATPMDFFLLLLEYYVIISYTYYCVNCVAMYFYKYVTVGYIFGFEDRIVYCVEILCVIG